MTEPTHLDEGTLACYAAGTIDADERASVQAHLAECAECRQEAAGLRRMLSVERRRRLLVRYTPMAAAAAVLLVVALPADRMGELDFPAIASSLHSGAGMTVSTAWLAGRLRDPSVVVLHLDKLDPAQPGPLYKDGHIPGARDVDVRKLFVTRAGLEYELPAPDSLREFLESRGISNSTHVILTGRPLDVTRAYVTLSYIGLSRISALDGGTTKWRMEGRRIERSADAGAASIARGRITIHRHPEMIAQRDYVLDHAGAPGVSLVDTRTPDEYNGIGAYHGVPNRGHIKGARLVDWRSYFQNDSDFALRDRHELKALMAEHVVPGDTVVAYCFHGLRSSSTYFVSRMLGYHAKLYDGSYQEWYANHLPTEVTPIPLLQ